MTRTYKIPFALSSVAAAAFAALYVLELQKTEQPQPATELARANLEEVRQQAPVIDRVNAELSEARVEIETLRKRLEQTENLVGVIEASVDQAIATPAPEAPVSGKSPMREMLDSMEPETMARMQASSVMQMGYARLFSELNLEPDKETQVRGILQAASEDQYRQIFSRSKAGDEMSSGQQKALAEATRIHIREQLAGILDPDQLAFFDRYDIDHEMVAGSIDVQLGTQAARLTKENRALAREVIVEELRAEREEPAPGLSGDPNIELDWQLRAFRNAETRLSNVLEPEQLELFRSFIEQQMTMIESMRQMMGEPTP